MSLFHVPFSRLLLSGLALTLCLTACKKKPTAEAPPPTPPPAVGIAVETESAPPPPQAPVAVEATPEIEKMSTEDKYWTEMADSITSFIQDHLRNKGRM